MPLKLQDNSKLAIFRGEVKALSKKLVRQQDDDEAIEEMSPVIAKALDGAAYESVRLSASRSNLRKNGVFFTSSELSAQLATVVLGTIGKKANISDVACGGADLLLPIYDALSRRDDNAHKNFKLYGHDVVQDFVDLAKDRLSLKQQYDSVINGAKPIPYFISKKDALTKKLMGGITHVVINPPFNPMKSTFPEIGTGKISAAAIFAAKCIKEMQPGTVLAAILPDALLSGTRYRAWRRFINDSCSLISLRRCGQFSDDVDVDVFILCVRKNEITKKSGDESAIKRTKKVTKMAARMAAFCVVNVGAVVPHRDPEKGPLSRYITAKNIPLGGVYAVGTPKLRFSGRLFTPPFLVIRRTSRPQNTGRAKPTIIVGSKPVAVENHLIVLTPLDGTLATCKKIYKILNETRTNQWLNKRIRCRHLTTAAVKEIPCW